MTTNAEEAKGLAKEIDALNKERQQIVNDITEEAVEFVEGMYPPDENSVLIVRGRRMECRTLLELSLLGS